MRKEILSYGIAIVGPGSVREGEREREREGGRGEREREREQLK